MEDVPAGGDGWAKWAFVHGMLGFGVPVGLCVYAVDVWFLGREGGTGPFLIYLGVFMLGGVIYGSFVKWWRDRKRGAAARP